MNATSAVRPDAQHTNALNTEVFRLMRTMQTLRNNVAAGPDGVPWSTYMLLFHLIGGGPQRAGALAEAAGADPSTVSRQVDWLVRMGLVERQADPSDGRATLLVATEAGVAVQQQMRAGRDRMMADVMQSWDADDVRHLTALLGRLNVDMSNRLPDLLATLPRRAPHTHSSAPTYSSAPTHSSPSPADQPKDHT